MMKEPGILEYSLLIATSLCFAVAGLYLMTNFSRLFRGTQLMVLYRIMSDLKKDEKMAPSALIVLAVASAI
ncbi:MAG: hypothetical protein AAB221_01325, partial [Bacteroidota bacterium]